MAAKMADERNKGAMSLNVRARMLSTGRFFDIKKQLHIIRFADVFINKKLQDKT